MTIVASCPRTIVQPVIYGPWSRADHRPTGNPRAVVAALRRLGEPIGWADGAGAGRGPAARPAWAQTPGFSCASRALQALCKASCKALRAPVRL
jgi:hypothetical protein